MEEFTNGTSPTAAIQLRAGIATRESETYCPYCGWVYDAPEAAIPDHAACGHLLATTQWTEGAYQFNIAAAIGADGRWGFWQSALGATTREALEHALRQVNVKVDSATAVADASPLSGRTWCRFYFSRRADIAVRELASTLPQAARPAILPSGPMCQAPCQMRA
jgi:hypothetical protein